MKEADNWIEFAKEDLVVAKASWEKKVFNQACFHAHQGVEKMLKGYLAAKGEDIPRTHFISALLKLCVAADGEFKKAIDLCLPLDDYYIPTRYPDALPGALAEGMPNEDDAKEALSILEEMFDFVRKKIERKK